MTDVDTQETKRQELERKVGQIFSPSAPIDQAQLFAGRLSQIKRLINAISERGRHAILYGERGVGKTSLTNILHALIGSNTVVPIRKQCSPEDDYVSLWKKVFRDITFTTNTDIGYGRQEQTQHHVADKYQDKITPDDVERELRNIAAQISAVIIFDEFDKVTSDNAKRLMSHTIKYLSDAGISVTIVIVGVADDINTLVDEHESVKRNIEEIKMPRMSNDELIEILNKRLPILGMKIDDEALWKIVTLSRGLPEYVHLLGRNAVFDAIKENTFTIQEKHVDNAIYGMIAESDQSSQSSNNAYKKAVRSNKSNALYSQVLLAAAMVKPDNEGRFTLTSIIEPLNTILGRRVEIANFQSHIAAFCTEERGRILEQYGTRRAYKYRFREPKMQPYVLMQGVNSGLISKNVRSVLLGKE